MREIWARKMGRRERKLGLKNRWRRGNYAVSQLRPTLHWDISRREGEAATRLMHRPIQPDPIGPARQTARQRPTRQVIPELNAVLLRFALLELQAL
jgi:hypothetical protein